MALLPNGDLNASYPSDSSTFQSSFRPLTTLPGVTMAGKFALPDELVCRIASFLRPQDTVDFACVNTQFSRCCMQRVNRCAKRSKELRLVHDRNLMTVPSLMRESMRDDTDLWFVRSFELWDLRDTFDHWKSPIFTEHNPDYVSAPVLIHSLFAVIYGVSRHLIESDCPDCDSSLRF